jgi:hypothetical protein
MAERAGIEPATVGVIRPLLVLKTSWATRPVLSSPPGTRKAIVAKESCQAFLKTSSNDVFLIDVRSVMSSLGSSEQGIYYQDITMS